LHFDNDVIKKRVTPHRSLRRGWKSMPRVSQFFGIAIYLYYRDHAPPHFHAIYGDDEAVFEIATGQVIAGHLPRRARVMVEEWLAEHRVELEQNWNLAVASQPLLAIPPLI
jgi:hypothetical protein